MVVCQRGCIKMSFRDILANDQTTRHVKPKNIISFTSLAPSCLRDTPAAVENNQYFGFNMNSIHLVGTPRRGFSVSFHSLFKNIFNGFSGYECMRISAVPFRVKAKNNFFLDNPLDDLDSSPP